MVFVEYVANAGFRSQPWSWEGPLENVYRLYKRICSCLGCDRHARTTRLKAGGGRVVSPSGCASKSKVGSWSEVWLNISLWKLKIALPPARELNFQKHEVSQNVRRNIEKVFHKGTPRKGKTAIGQLYGSNGVLVACMELESQKWQIKSLVRTIETNNNGLLVLFCMKNSKWHPGLYSGS